MITVLFAGAIVGPVVGEVRLGVGAHVLGVILLAGGGGQVCLDGFRERFRIGLLSGQFGREEFRPLRLLFLLDAGAVAFVGGH